MQLFDLNNRSKVSLEKRFLSKLAIQMSIDYSFLSIFGKIFIKLNLNNHEIIISTIVVFCN